MSLKPQDVLVALKLVAIGRQRWTYAHLAVQLGMSPSQLHSAVRRLLAARLVRKEGESIIPNLQNLEEFLVHGVKYVFVAEMGEITRGMPTAYAASPLAQAFVSAAEPPPVWPDPQGEVRGQAFSPLHKLAPQAARNDADLYELLVLVDAIRAGRARERALAITELKKRLSGHAE